jgi:hypothetical protein
MANISAKRRNQVHARRRKQLSDYRDLRHEKLRRRVWLIMRRRHPQATDTALELLVGKALKHADHRRRAHPEERWRNLEERLSAAITKRRELALTNRRIAGKWHVRELAARIRADERLMGNRPLLAHRIRAFEQGKLADIVPAAAQPRWATKAASKGVIT